MPSNYPIMILFSLVGILFILLALLNQRLLRWIGLKPLSEVFTNPGFQRSANLTEKLARVLLALLGVAFLVQGPGNQFLPAPAVQVLSIIVLALAGLILLAMFGVVLVHWKAK